MSLLFVFGAAVAAPVHAWTGFSAYHHFPSPAPGAFGVTGVGLPDGRLLLWNGGDVYVQFAPNADSFTKAARGYVGDPGFAALSPNREFVILGQGFGGALYRYDLQHPQDYTPASVVGTQPHFGGILLTDSLVLLDAGREDFSGSDLLAIDIGGAKSAPAVVVRKSAKYLRPKEVVVPKPPFAYSSSLAIDSASGTVYAMDGNTRELRAFSLAGLIGAFLAHTPLDWEIDGVLIGAAGAFFSGGVAGVRPGGNLIVPGSSGFMQPGGVQIVNPRLDNPSLAAVVQLLDPAGTQPFYSAIYSSGADSLTVLTGDGVAYGSYVTGNGLTAVPAAEWSGLVALALLLVWSSRRVLRARRIAHRN